MSYEEKSKQHERQFARVEDAMTAAEKKHVQDMNPRTSDRLWSRVRQ